MAEHKSPWKTCRCENLNHDHVIIFRITLETNCVQSSNHHNLRGFGLGGKFFLSPLLTRFLQVDLSTNCMGTISTVATFIAMRGTSHTYPRGDLLSTRCESTTYEDRICFDFHLIEGAQNRKSLKNCLKNC